MTPAGLADASAIGLAAVFSWAAVVKLLGRSATEQSFIELGLVAPRVLSIVVPMIELSAAGLLLAVAPVGAALALFLLVAFCVVLASAIRSGLVVGCACFGATPDHPVGPLDIVRNVGLALMCQLAIFGRSPVRPELVSLAVTAGVMIVGWATLRRARVRARSEVGGE